MKSPYDGVAHVVHSVPAGRRCLRSLRLQVTDRLPSQIILCEAAALLLASDEEVAMLIHEFAGLAVPVLMVTDDLADLGIDVTDVPMYLFREDRLETAVYYARQYGLRVLHWL